MSVIYDDDEPLAHQRMDPQDELVVAACCLAAIAMLVIVSVWGQW